MPRKRTLVLLGIHRSLFKGGAGFRQVEGAGFRAVLRVAREVA